jgi:Protein of unknown function (DUF982)
MNRQFRRTDLFAVLKRCEIPTPRVEHVKECVMAVHIKPLEIEIDGEISARRNCRELLMGSSWPEGGKQFHSALWRSMEALDSVTEADIARAAFVDAAHEVGMHVLPDDMAEIRKAG